MNYCLRGFTPPNNGLQATLLRYAAPRLNPTVSVFVALRFMDGPTAKLGGG